MSARELSLRELFAIVAPEAASAEEEQLRRALHDAEGSEAPLLVRVFTAVGTWIGAMMMAVFFVALELHEVTPVALFLALGLFAGAVVLSRRPRRSLALTQLAWAMGLASHGLVTLVCFEEGASDEAVASLLVVIAIISLFAVRIPSYQLAAAVSAVAFGTWLTIELWLPAPALWVALPAAAVATAAWIYEVPLTTRLGRTWGALAYGLPIGVAGPLSLVGFDDEGLVASGPEATVATVLLLGLVAAVLLRARSELEGQLERRAYVLGGLAVLAVLVARNVPGLTLALLWLLVAHLRRSAGLQVIASLQLGGFLFLFYYQLDTTLLLKSLWVLSTGVVVLVAAFVVRVRREDEAEAEQPARRARWGAALGLIALSGAIVLGSAAHKQRVISSGETVLLPLAPVDPRSLMQGDYMELRYALEGELTEAVGLDQNGELQIPRHGQLIVRVDARGVGHFARLDHAEDEGSALADDELRIEYRVRDGWGGRLRIGGESFLFEEGTAELYEAARYGELVVADDGEVVLVGLRDEQLRSLGVRLHERAPTPRD